METSRGVVECEYFVDSAGEVQFDPQLFAQTILFFFLSSTQACFGPIHVLRIVYFVVVHFDVVVNLMFIS